MLKSVFVSVDKTASYVDVFQSLQAQPGALTNACKTLRYLDAGFHLTLERRIFPVALNIVWCKVLYPQCDVSCFHLFKTELISCNSIIINLALVRYIEHGVNLRLI